MTLAMTQFPDMECITASGPCPAPNIPYPPLSWTTAPWEVMIHGPRAARATYGLTVAGL